MSDTLRYFLLLLLLPAALTLQAEEAETTQLQLAGAAEYRYLFWRVYDAELYAPEGSFQHFESLPFVLKLHYRRAFSSEQIVAETGRQFAHLGLNDEDRLRQWLASLGSILPDVSRGDVISLRVDSSGASHFYLNEGALGSITDASFSEYFSAIWLSDRSSDPEFTRRLRGDT